jgi:hypothetical protein
MPDGPVPKIEQHALFWRHTVQNVFRSTTSVLRVWRFPTVERLRRMWPGREVNCIAMIIVTGTRRSGTSAWMQILEKGGFQVLGDAFPATWRDRLEAANPRGFYESTLVQGINYKTNPDPKSGMWLPPDKVTQVAVKIFADGLVKTDFAYIDRVIFTVRRWQDCEASQIRMDEIKSKHPEIDFSDINTQRAARLPKGYLWWKANFSLVKDMRTRGYPVAAVSYEALLADPEKIVDSVFKWIGAGNAVAATTAIEKSLQTQSNVRFPEIEHGFGDIFDELYDILDRNQKITATLYQRWFEVDRAIDTYIDELLSSS